ncbi:DUF397 domain-containing protein [Nocardia sp. NPDC057668]|uniref:DUF397 domain-containing protein n=1 Tax=Nocardia sp. NPDC057668 TaxID=3346202 RepID=UPI0036703700
MIADLSGAEWFKSSYSGDKADCVEVAFVENVVAVRDSKAPCQPGLVFSIGAWEEFVNGVAGQTFTS